MVIFTSALFLGLLIWQSISASSAHQAYQKSLMNSVSEQVLSDYQEYFNQLRLEIDLFQQTNKPEINALNQSKEKALEADYMKVYHLLKKNIENSRLFALIDENGDGTLQHITGEFLPSCQEEVQDTLLNGTQERLFLHRSKTSVHFDLLQPLLSSPERKEYFFTAFNLDVLQAVLIKYQLPHQQLFLMRSDNIGKIELTSETDNTAFAKMTMSAEQLTSFSSLKSIPKTRWQIAIRLDPSYSSKIYITGILKALIIWLILTVFIVVFYRIQKKRMLKHAVIEHKLNYKDKHDKLTGLVNRAHFDQTLSDLISEKKIQQENDHGAVIHVDIDNFQVINRQFGYATGDKVLFQLSLSLKDLLPEDATFSRLGNDEFAIILPSLYHISSASFTDKIRQYIQSINYDEINRDITISSSIGLVILDNTQLDVEQVLSSLNMSVTLAKQKGGNRVQLYQSDDQLLKQHAAEMDIIHELSQALSDQNLVLYRQEILATSEPNNSPHFEVLVRLKNASGDIVSPGIFIPAAEKYGLIKELDKEVISKTFAAIAKKPTDNASYSINLSGASLTDKDTCNFIRYEFKKHGIDPKRICFEITETSAISHLKSALKFIQQLRELGCYFALDDFGSGHSSFSYLQQLPIQIIKIDGVFVRDIDHNLINRIFVENIQRTAKAMNLKTVAEFVENQEIVNQLDKIGVDNLQGYHIHKPEFWV